MFRYLFATLILAATLSMSGCVLGPCGGGGGNCNGCDGASCGSYAVGPLQSFRSWRRGLTCSSGCGEIYYDEWSSTPPDCVDPCPEFAGDGCGRGRLGSRLGGCMDICGCGDSGCLGGCGFQPLRRVASAVVGLYGKRFCGDCGYAVDDCGCGGGDPWAGYGGGECCDGCSGGGGGGGCASAIAESPKMKWVPDRGWSCHRIHVTHWHVSRSSHVNRCPPEPMSHILARQGNKTLGLRRLTRNKNSIVRQRGCRKDLLH